MDEDENYGEDTQDDPGEYQMKKFRDSYGPGPQGQPIPESFKKAVKADKEKRTRPRKVFTLAWDKVHGPQIIGPKSKRDLNTAVFQQIRQQAAQIFADVGNPTKMAKVWGVTSQKRLKGLVKKGTPARKFKSEETRKAAKRAQDRFKKNWGGAASVGRLAETSKMSNAQKYARAANKARVKDNLPKPIRKRSTGPKQTPQQRRQKATARRVATTNYDEDVYSYARDDDLFMN